MTSERTQIQKNAIAALRASREAGMGLSAYAQAHGLNPRQIHDSITGLRKRGLIPPTDRPKPRKGAFVAVRVVRATTPSPAMTPPPRTGMVCRVVHASGLVIECGQWPPAVWLRSLAAGP